MSHAVNRLRDYCQTLSTRPFKARGSFIQRCSRCLLADFTCLCDWQKTMVSPIEFILIMHRNEIHKPTNTGRLIADMFPHNTQAFLWDRLNPDPQLLAALKNPERQQMLLFPEKESATKEEEQENIAVWTKPLSLVLLDGTWKQASRMARLSPWLQHLPKLQLQGDILNSSYIRQAPGDHQLSTALAASQALQQLGHTQQAESLYHYFTIFNLHCQATRRNTPPPNTEHHNFIEQINT